MKRNGSRRKVSAGTVFMLIFAAVVLAGSAAVLVRLSSGASVDLNKLNMNILDLRAGKQPETNEVPAEKQQEPVQSASFPEAAGQKGTKAPSTTEAPVSEAGPGSFTLTLGGNITLSDEVRKNCWNTDSKTCDYSDIMTQLAPEIRSDISIVFLENIYSDNYKANDTVAPEAAADLLKEARFNMAACGFSQAYAKETDGIEMTRLAMMERSIRPLGIRDPEEQDTLDIRNIGGMKAAFLQYTGTIAAKTRKAMERDNTTGTVPEAEAGIISDEIASAREQGAEAVIVLLNWGKIGKEPDKKQRELAEAVAAAGADLIVGSGSHTPQAAEYLAGRNGKQVLCVWSLGSLLSGDRKNVSRMSGYLLHVTVRGDGKGGAEVSDPEYTPVYTWKYKQDGRFYYRCIVSDRDAPDGMDNEQQKNLEKSRTAVSEVLKDMPLVRREQE